MRLPTILAAALCAAALSACATGTGPDAARDFDSFAGQSDLRAYEAVYVAPATAGEDVARRVGYNPVGATDRTRPIGERELARQLEELTEALERRLGEVVRLAPAPGPGVLTIETELTALAANRPTQAEVAATPSLDFRSISVGDAGVRMTLSENGRTLATLEDRAFRRNLNDPGIGVGIWNTADRFYDRLSRKVAALLR